MGAKKDQEQEPDCQSKREGKKKVRSQTDAQESFKRWVLSKEQARLKQDQGMALELRSQQSSNQGWHWATGAVSESPYTSGFNPAQRPVPPWAG